MDAAHLSQSLQLICSNLGLGSFITAAIHARKIDEELGLNPIAEGALAICGAGRRFPNEAEIPTLRLLDPQFLPYTPRQTPLSAPDDRGAGPPDGGGGPERRQPD
jgi:nitroreductase